MSTGKKVILGIVFVGLLAGGLVLSFQFESRKSVQTSPVPSAKVAEVSAILAKDSDNDGLKDWEEELWQTDPNLSDTDGDGTSDGEEITAGRNPFVKGPDDKLDEQTFRTKVNAGIDEEETPTDRFSREFFNRYLELRRQSGGELPPEALAFLIQDSLNDAPKIVETKTYDATDLTLIGSSAESLRSYGNAVGLAIFENSPAGLEDVYAIFERALSEGQEGELAKITLHITSFDGLIKRLLAILVPATSADAHLQVLNASEGIKKGLAGIQNLYTDPLNALPSLALYQESAQKLAEGLTSIQAIFIKANIRFSPDESGYLLEQLGI